MITALITVVHVVVCIILIVVVLLQHGKSADIAATFGGMGSQTAFGPRGTATALSRLTTWCAIIFMLTSMSLTFFASRKGATSNSIMQGVKNPQRSCAADTTEVDLIESFAVPSRLCGGSFIWCALTVHLARQCHDLYNCFCL